MALAKVGELVPKGRNAFVARAEPKPAVVTADPEGQVAAWFDGMFRELLVTCSAWRHSLPNGDFMRAAKKQWIKALAEAGITDEVQVRDGIAQLRQQGQQFLISPADFVALCGRGDGIPNPEAAYAEALEKIPLVRYQPGLTVRWSTPCRSSGNWVKETFMGGRWRIMKSVEIDGIKPYKPNNQGKRHEHA